MLAFRAVLFTVLLPGTTLVWIPQMLAARDASRLELPVFRWFGLPLAAVGAGVLLVCIVDFARKGRGTLAPVDPPRNLVASGLYRHVRNPMYFGAVALLVGQAMLFESKSVLLYAGLSWLASHLFVLAYEEPHLKRTFGAEYEEYRAGVPRWLPRLRPWAPRETW
ncbi:MAG TPA: isoprenylcysteine carboxylmethyltransferase family protein [Thermoanaerobaculia bacterium]|jgi:protein-S-isoprenylcysteine O-methyltransferase Ste14